MYNPLIKDNLIWLIVSLFLLSLALPAFYITPTHEPLLGYHLLIWGWLGPIDLHFSWFANLFFLVSVAKLNRPTLSFTWALIALFTALSFLLKNEIIVNGVPAHAKITSYGWGYFIWIISIGALAWRQLSHCLSKKISPNTNLVIAGSFLSLGFMLFYQHYYSREESHAKLQEQREAVFKEQCKTAKEVIYAKLDLRNHGIYITSEFNQSFIKSNGWKSSGSGRLVGQVFYQKLLAFYEMKNEHYLSGDNQQHPYEIHVLNGSRATPSSKIESRYKISISQLNYPKELAIYGAEATITSIEDGSIIAKSSYVFDRMNGRFCGHNENDHYSFGDFLTRVLTL